MSRHFAHDGEAAGLPACACAAVRLRLSAAERLWWVVRWVFGLAGAVVVLWIGSALLASPASAAVVAPVAVQQSLLKGGGSSRQASGGDGDSGSGSSDSSDGDSGGDDSSGDGEDSGDSESKDDKEEKSEEKPEKKDEKKEKKKESKESKESGERDQADDQQERDQGKRAESRERPEPASREERADREPERSESKHRESKHRESEGSDSEQDDTESPESESDAARKPADNADNEAEPARAEGERARDGDGQADDERTRDEDTERLRGDDDRDGDARAEDLSADGAEADGTVAKTAGAEDTGAEITGSENASDNNAGAAENVGAENTGSENTGSENTGSEVTAAEDERTEAGHAEAGRDAVGRDADAEGEDIQSVGRRSVELSGSDQADDESGRGDDEPRASGADTEERVAAIREAAEEGDSEGVRERVRDLVRDHVRDAVADARELGERPRDAADDAADDARTDGHSAEDGQEPPERGVTDSDVGRVVEGLVRAAADRADISDDDVERVEGAVREALDRTDARRGDEPSAEDREGLARLVKAGDDRALETAAREGMCEDDGCAETDGVSALSTREFSDTRSRGPPQERDAEDGRDAEDDEDEREYDDSAEQTERVLEGRIEVDDSKKELAAEKEKLAAGKTTQAEYDKKAAEHKELEQQVAADRAELSPDRVELVDEVVDGHRELSERESELAAEEKKVAAGGVTKAAHEKNVADFDERRDEVYEATDELMDATDRDAGVLPEDGLDGEGAAAGCGSDGAFVECGSVSESADGELDSDREVCLSGVSSGCGASTQSGDSKAEASCDASGCGSSASSRGADGKITKASARCDGAAEGCGQHSIATPEGSAAYCDSGGGACRSESSGPDRDAATPPDPGRSDSADRRTAASASCTGECGVDSIADRSAAEAGCDTAGGTCDSSSTGSGTERPDVSLAGTEAASAELGEARRQGRGTAHCEGTGRCGTSSSVDLGDSSSTDEVVADADVECATGCTGSATSSTNAGHGSGAATSAAQGTPESATNGTAECTVSGGSCGARSGSRADDDGESRGSVGSTDAAVEVGCGAGCTGTGTTSTAGTASGVRDGAARESTGRASCEATGSGCQAHSSTEVDNPVDEQAGWLGDGGTVRTAALTDGDATASSSAGAHVDCAAAACSGKSSSATTGTVTGTPATAGAAAPVRKTSSSSACDARAGGCGVESSSRVSDSAAEPSRPDQLAAAGGTTLATRELTATSTGEAQVDCAVATCTGSGSSTTSGGASGDVQGVRDSTGSSSCTAQGAGGSCTTSADTTVADRDPADAAGTATGVAAVSGPVSTSNASASVECSGAVTACGGTATSSTSARDTGVSPHARGTSATAECTVTGGGCSGETSSAASSAPDFVAVDPNTGLPLPGQSLSGPSSTSSSSASLACEAGTACSGSVRTSTTAWDGAVANGAPRTSEGTAGCTGGTGGCQVQSVSNASTGPGAALALSSAPQDGAAQQVNTARLPAGPSAASAAGAALVCEGQAACTGKVTSAATATDPSVSPDARGSHSEGSCEGVSGGVCQAVTNSGASSGPDANVIAPLVAERSTANATVTSGTTGDQAPAEQPRDGAPGQEQPATLPAPTAPGSSANSGGPTVPGASSWTMASAALDCGGGIACSGTARTSAAGSDGPTAVNSGNGARGPPEGASTSSATCTSGQSGCQAQTSSTAGSGQVVADIVAEQQNDAAEQARQQAREAEQRAAEAARVAARPGATAEQLKTAADTAAAAEKARGAATEATELAARPVTDAPAAMSQSSATAECAGPGCTATTTGGTSGVPGTSTTTATCTAAVSGCAATSDAIATIGRDSGQTTGEGKNAKPVRGTSGTAETTSRIVCPAGCTGAVTGGSTAEAGPQGQRGSSTATGDTRCDGTTACVAQVSAGTNVAASAPGAGEDAQFAGTGAWVSAACDNGTANGCATRASSRASAVGADGVRASSTATCATAGACMVGTAASAAKDLAEATANCAGTGCRTHTDGRAQAASPGGQHTAVSRSDCTAAAAGQCSGSSRVAASAEYALAGAECAATKGSSCSFSYRADGHASDGGARADAVAHGAGTLGRGVALASAHAEDGVAQASAACTGSGGVRCGHSYSANASASAAFGGNRASASASGSGGGGIGSGAVAVSAQASAGPGNASASASCAGAANCRHSYSASASASASFGGNRASASASGSGGGATGGGGVAVTAQASAGPGYASAGASCFGAPNCRHSYSASASASASYDDGTHRSWARASASGSGGGGTGGGGLTAHAQARAGKGFAHAAAGCSGVSNCSASYSTHAEASQTVGGQHGEAWSTCSGGGSGGSCGSFAVVKVDADSAFAQAGCSGTGSCASHYATRSGSSASGEGISGNSGGNCSGSQASGGYCATGSKATYDPKTGELKLSSYCATEGGSCSRWANIDIDAASLNGELTGEGAVRCAGGTGSCGIIGVAKYHPATTKDGKRVPPTLVLGTGCETQGGGSCSHWSTGNANITGADGNVGATAVSKCAGTTGWCSTVVAGEYNAETGQIDAYAECAAGPGSACAKSEAHLVGEVYGPGQAVPGGPTLGTIQGNGRTDCVRASGVCSVSGVFTYHGPERAYQKDDNGNFVLDENGNKIPVFEKDKNGNYVLDDNGNKIPVYDPAYVNVQTGCFPEGPGCSQEAHVSGNVDERGEHQRHTGTANADCSGTSGSCNLIGSVAYNPETGKVTAFTDCVGGGGARCTRSETHTDAWVRSPDGKLTGTGRSDCTETSGLCSSVSIAKYHAEYTKYPPKCTSPHGCFQNPPQTIPEHVVVGAGCETSGNPANCSFSFEAGGQRHASGDDGRLGANARGGCAESHAGQTGSGGCSVAATAKVDAETRTAEAIAWCEGSASCSYFADATANHESEKNNAESHKQCGKNAAGTCFLSVRAIAAGGDDERQGVAVASGMCTDSNNTCEGSFRTHVDSNWDTLADCHSSGNGTCIGVATPKNARSGGSVEDDGTVLHLSSKAPGGTSTANCSNDSPCQEGMVEGLPGKYFVLDRETEKTVGRFFKNLARDGGDVIVHAVPGLVSAVGTELGSWVTAAEWGDGLGGYAENRPFTGGIAQGAVNFYDRWGGTGSTERLGDDYYFAPASTLLEDVGTVALVAFGAGAIIKGISLGAKGAGAAASAATATNGLRGALASAGRRVGSWAPGLNTVGTAFWDASLVGGNVALSPLKLNFAVGRFAVGHGAKFVLPRVGTWAASRTPGVLNRATAAFDRGRLGTGMSYLATASALDRAGSLLSRNGAHIGSIIRQGGIFGRLTVRLVRNESGLLTVAKTPRPGLIGTVRAYNRLGLTFGTAITAAQLTAAHTNASAGVSGGSRTVLGRVIGDKLATAVRQRGVDWATRNVWIDQTKRGETLVGGPRLVGGPARLSGVDLTPAQRLAVEEAIARGVVVEELTPAQLSELTGIPVSEITAAGCRGVCAVDGLNRSIAGQLDDLVLYSHPNGFTFIDSQILGALRDGRLSPDALANLFRHELDELNRGGRAHGELHALPDLSPLAGDVAAANRGGAVRSGRPGVSGDVVVARPGQQGERGSPGPPPRPGGHDPSAPPAGARTGERTNSSGGGGDDLATGEAGTGGGPRPHGQEQTPPPTSEGYKRAVVPWESDLPPPGQVPTRSSVRPGEGGVRTESGPAPRNTAVQGAPEVGPRTGKGEIPDSTTSTNGKNSKNSKNSTDNVGTSGEEPRPGAAHDTNPTNRAADEGTAEQGPVGQGTGAHGAMTTPAETNAAGTARSSSGTTQPGGPARPEKTAPTGEVAPGGTREQGSKTTVETADGVRVTIEAAPAPNRSRVEALENRIAEVREELNRTRGKIEAAASQDLWATWKLRPELERLRAEQERLRSSGDGVTPRDVDIPGVHYREVGEPIEVAPGITVQRVEATPRRAADRARRTAEVEARIAQIEARLRAPGEADVLTERVEALETELSGLGRQLVDERARLDGPSWFDVGTLPGQQRPAAGADAPTSTTSKTTSNRSTAADAGESPLPPAPAKVKAPSRWSTFTARVQELSVKVGLTLAVALYMLVPHQQAPLANSPHPVSHSVSAEAGAGARSLTDGLPGAADIPSPRTTSGTGTAVADGSAPHAGHTSTMNTTGTIGARPGGTFAPGESGLGGPAFGGPAFGGAALGGAAAGGTGLGEIRPGLPDAGVGPAGVEASAERTQSVPETPVPTDSLRTTPPQPAWDRRLLDLGGTPHIRLFGLTVVFDANEFEMFGRVVHADVWAHVSRSVRPRTAAENRRPGHISESEWAGYTPAQRAEAWDAAGPQAKRERLGIVDAEIRAVEDLLNEQDREIRAYERKTAVVRSKAALPPPKRTKAERGMRPQVSVQREAERARARLAAMGGQRDEIAEHLAELERLRADLVERLEEFAELAQGYAAMHRTIAESTRGGRRQLAQIEQYRAAGVTSVQVRDVTWARRLGAWLRPRVSADVAADVQKLVDAGDRAALMTLMTAGLAARKGDAVLTRFAEKHGFEWGPARRAELLAALPSTMRDSLRVSKPPRNAAWPEEVRRQRTMLAAGGVGGAALLLGGGLAALGWAGSALLLVSWLGVAQLSSAALRLVPDMLRIRGPPALARMVAAAGGLSTAVSIGVPVLAGADGMTVAAAVAGTAIGAVLFTANGPSVKPVRGERAAHPVRIAGSRLGRAAALGAVVLALAAPLVVGLASPALAEPSVPTAATSAGASTGAVAEVRGERPQDVTVQRGDTLSRLAAGLGVSVDALAAANGDRFPSVASRDHIDPGEQLRIPAHWTGTWTVQPGDTLTRIAAGLRVEVDALASAQGGRFGSAGSRNLILPGEVFTIPVDRSGPTQPGPTEPGPTEPGPGRPTPTPAPTETPAPAPTPKETPSPAPSQTQTPNPSESPSSSQSPTPAPSRTPGAQDETGATPAPEGAEQPRAPPNPSAFWVRALLAVGAAMLVIRVGTPIVGGARRWIADRDARTARRDQLDAVSTARRAVEAADPADRQARTEELVDAVRRASIAGASDWEIARKARWSTAAVRVTVALRQGRDRLPEMTSGSPAEQAGNRVLDALTALAAELQGNRRAPQARVAQAWALLAELDALVRGTWSGLEAWKAAAEGLGAGLAWQSDGSVRVSGAGGKPVRLLEAQVRLAQLGLAEQIDAQVPGERVALEARAWVAGQLADARGGSSVAAAINALAAAAKADLAPRDVVLLVAEDVLRHNGGLPAARAGGLKEAGTRLVDEVAAEVRAAQRRRTALHEDRSPAVDEIERVLRELGSLPPADQAAVIERLAGLVAEQRTAFEDARYALFELISAKRRQATAAAKAETGARASGRNAAQQGDRGAAERRRKARADVAVAKETRERAQRSRDAYLEVRALAGDAGRLYERLFSRLAGVTGAPSAAAVRDLLALAGSAARAVEAYQQALAAARPPRDAIPAGVPTAHLPHLDELTRAVNAQLAAQGARRRYTKDALDAKLRASFRDVASDEGLLIQEPGAGRRSPLGWLLRRPRTGVAEVWIALRADGVTEVARPELRYGRQASEVMLGALPQGGFSGAATSARSFGFNFGVSFDAEALLDVVPVEQGSLGALKALASGASAKFGVSGSRGRNDSGTGSASGYALGGGVTDNRGDSLLYEAYATWDVGVRPAAGSGTGTGWAITDRVTGRRTDRGDPARPADTDLMAIWTSHAYQARAPPRTTQLPPDQRQRTELPHHAPISVSGRQLLADRTVAALGDGRGPVGDMTRAQVRAFLVDELPGRLGAAVNDPAGLQRTVIDDAGRPLAHLVAKAQVKTLPTYDGRSGLMVGLPTPKEFLEDLHVWFSSVGGGQSSGRSRGLKVSLSFGLAVLTTVAVALFGDSGERFTSGLSAEGGASSSRSIGSSTSEVAIHPGVHRYTGHTQSYRLDVTFTVDVQRLDERGHPVTTVTSEGEAVVRMPEAAAYRYGLPVAAEAVTWAPDGKTVLRGDRDKGAPKGRKGELPEWLGPDGVRDPGHGLVRDMTGVLAVREQVLKRLEKEGLVPPSDPAKWSTDPRVLGAQLANQRAVLEHLTALTLQTGYSQAVTSELALTLSDGSVLRTRLEQRWDTVEYLGHTTAWTVVGLDIKSSTAGQSGGQSRGGSGSVTGNGAVAIGDDTAPEPGFQTEESASGELGANAGGGRSSGRNGGATGNVVTLVEGTGPTAVFRMGHVLVVELQRPGGTVVDAGKGEVTADLLLPSDLLPDAEQYRETGSYPTSAQVLRRMTPLALDAHGLLDQVVTATEAQLPAGWRLDPSAVHQLREFTSVLSLRSSLLELLEAGLRTRVRAVHAVSGSTRWVPVVLRGRAGQSSFVTAADLVLGDINLTLGSNGGESANSRSGGISSKVKGAFTWLPFVDSASVNGSYSGSRGRSWSWLSIWGRERLLIEVGKQHVHRMGLQIDVAVGGQRSAPVKGTVVYALPERDALQTYAETGKRTIPLEQVSDAVQRWLQRDLALDDRLAYRLVPVYLDDVRAARRAGRPVSALAKGHTRPKLAARLVDPDGKRTRAVPPLEKVLAAGRRKHRDEERVVLPEHYATDMAESLFEDAELSRGGNPTTLFDEVRGAIEEVVPGAFGRDAVRWDWVEDRLAGSPRRRSVDAPLGVNGYGREGLAWNWLSDNLAGTRWRGHIDAMLGPDGFGTRLPVRVRPGVGSSGVEWVDVRINARFTGEPIRVGRTDAVVMLIQDYAYEQGGFGRSAGRTIGGGVAGDVEAFGQGGSGNVGTDRSRGSSGDASEQITTLRGLGSFDGADRIQQGVRFDITVERTAALPGLLPAGLRKLPAPAELLAPDPKTATPVTVSGTIVRLVPDGLVTAAEAKGSASAPAGAVMTSRPFRMPQQVRVDARGNTTLGERLRSALADPRLLGPLGVHENRGELHNAISPVALSVFLPRMVGADGHFVGRFPVPGRPGEFVEVWLRAALFEEDVVVTGRKGIEIRTVFRDQGTAGTGETTGQRRPLSRGGGFSPADLGVNVGTSHGEQGSRRVAGSGGLRRETTLYEKGTVSTVRVRADYELVLRRVTVRDGAVRRTRHEVRLPAGSGTTYVTLFDADHQAPYTGVRFGRTEPTEVHVARRSGAAWPVALWSRGPAVQSGGATYGSVGVGGGPIAVGGYSPAQTGLMRGALERMWRAELARRDGAPVRNRGPPEAGLRADEELFVPHVSDVVEQLRRDGLSRMRAEDLARRLVEFSWRDEVTGLGVIVVPEHRLAELRRAGLLGDAVVHARRFHLAPNARHDQHAHDADAGRVLDRLGRTGGWPTAMPYGEHPGTRRATARGVGADEVVATLAGHRRGGRSMNRPRCCV